MPLVAMTIDAEEQQNSVKSGADILYFFLSLESG